ncbi:hypothetical protein AB0J81_13590 [Streptomyces bobili]|jgi:hypothetical protein|uniref:hypothetical protein n=1 Tax=Streptomyces bobili TaxID=67280 RepID=UPI00343168C1
MNALTLRELELQYATLNHRAEKLRQEWRTLPHTPRSAALGKQIKDLQQRADDYGRLLDGLKQDMEGP